VNTWDPSAVALLTLLSESVRGPKREGIFALWLTLRVAQDLLLDPPPLERAHRRRVQALEQRLSSLTIPPPLRRALTAAVSQLVAPARESGGSAAGEALTQAARTARAALRAER